MRTLKKLGHHYTLESLHGNRNMLGAQAKGETSGARLNGKGWARTELGGEEMRRCQDEKGKGGFRELMGPWSN